MQRFFDSLKKGFLTTGALFYAGYKSGKTRLFQPFQHFFGVVPVGEGPHLHPEQAVSLGLGRGLFRLGRSIGHPQILAEAPGDGLADFIGVLDDKFLPEWAKPKLAELQAQEQTDAPTMGGMNMK